MTGRPFMIMLLIGLAIISVAAAAEPPVKEGQPIYKVRPILLRQGWKPVETFTPGDFAEFAHNDGDARAFFRHGFKEVESCTGMEENYCVFNYSKGDRCLVVHTAGEYFPPRYPEVRGWWTYPVAGKNKTPICSGEAANKPPPKQGGHSVP